MRRSPVDGRADRAEGLAQIVLALQAVLALTAGQDWGRQHPLAHATVRNVCAHRNDGAGEVRSRNARQRDLKYLAFAQQQVETVDAACVHLNENLVGSGLRCGNVDAGERLGWTVTLDLNCEHVDPVISEKWDKAFTVESH